MVRYRHTKTGEVIETPDVQPAFEQSARFVRVDVEPEVAPAGDMDALKREELNERARELGVEDPEKLPNKQAVIDAIKAAEEQPAD